MSGCGKDLITPALWLPKVAPASVWKGRETPPQPSQSRRMRDTSDRGLGYAFHPTWHRTGPPEIPSEASVIVTSTNNPLLNLNKEKSPPIPIPPTQYPPRGLPNVKRLRKDSHVTKTPVPAPSPRFRSSPARFLSPAQTLAPGRYGQQDESSASARGNRAERSLTLDSRAVPYLDQSRGRGIPAQAERISIVPVPFPFLFPVVVSSTPTSNPLDPIEDLE